MPTCLKTSGVIPVSYLVIIFKTLNIYGYSRIQDSLFAPLMRFPLPYQNPRADNVALPLPLLLDNLSAIRFCPMRPIHNKVILNEVNSCKLILSGK